VPDPFQCITLSAQGLLREIAVELEVTSPTADPDRNPPAVVSRLRRAVFDTGAMATCISPDVVSELGLTHMGVTDMTSASGHTETRRVYLVNIQIPIMAFRVLGVPAVEAQPGGCDVLIGMDLITLGDFSITNVGHKTTFSFRVPSQKTVDYVTELGRIKAVTSPRVPQAVTPRPRRPKRR
jgi:predicted aspartyl protease